MSIESYPRTADWITSRDGRLQVHTGKIDIGQRISTALAQIVHEELTVPLSDIDVLQVRTGHAPDEGITSGSNSVEQSGRAVRLAAATLRAALRARAAARHGGKAADWRLEDGRLHLPGTNQRHSVIEIIGDIDPDTQVEPGAKPVDRPAGALPRPAMRGLRELVEGRYVFVHDLHPEGMWHARVVRPPHAGARLAALPQDAVSRLEERGLKVIRDGSFLAVAGPSEWPVAKAVLGLASACDWDMGEGLPEGDVFESLTPENARRFPLVDAAPQEGPVPPPLTEPDHSRRYERPYQMHGALAPSAALAHWDGAVLRLHTHSQGVYVLRDSLADSLGLAVEAVDIEQVPGSGCYGHNGADDAALEAALCAMQMPGTPVLLKWTREEEHAWEPYAPAMAVELAARLEKGRVTAYSAEAFSDTHRGRPRAGPKRAGPSKLLANRFRADPVAPLPAQPNMGKHAGLHRNLEPLYDFGETRLVKNLVSGPHRTSAMRCLGAAANLFAHESFVDEIARENGSDPISFRLEHLSDPRDRAVLTELARLVRSRPDPGEGAGRGVAYAQYKNRMTRVGVCVELTVNDRVEVQLHHAILVADAGRVIDAEGLAAQLEGGFIQAASWALYEEVTWDRDGILSRDWERYPVIRFDNVPTVDVRLLDHPEAEPVGAGEASPGPALAAIANALHDAIGVRMHRLPFTPEAITNAVLHD